MRKTGARWPVVSVFLLSLWVMVVWFAELIDCVGLPIL